MHLTTEIISINIDTENYENHKVQFSCCDADEEGQVSFVDSINLAHACFLIESDIVSITTAYGQMLHKMVNEGIEGLTVGETFRSVD